MLRVLCQRFATVFYLIISVTILKANVNTLSNPPSFIIKRSFEDYIFPEPLSLLSVFSKIFEKSLYNRISSFLCKHELINTNQISVQSKHSTVHALIHLAETVKKWW